MRRDDVELDVAFLVQQYLGGVEVVEVVVLRVDVGESRNQLFCYLLNESHREGADGCD